jgi:predicted enzyme related to lactoylglutathione lyase
MTAAIGLVLDCNDPQRMAAFWAAALGYREVGSLDSYTLLLPPEGEAGPQVLLQAVAEPKAAKNRMHFDVHTPDVDAERDRLVGLGASVLRSDPFEEHGIRWWVMADPEGNEFCVCSAPTAH